MNARSHALVNTRCQGAWNPLLDHPLPAMKLASKERVGSKVVRQHGEAKTPLHRGLTCAEVSPATKKRLRTEKRANNPFALTREVERHVKVIEAGDQRRLDRGAETDRKKPVKKRERG